jgi:F420-dependent oxidoreductase-like protein
MRFAIKNAPQHVPWADMLALWREADQIDLFESAWSFDHFYPIQGDANGPCLEGWTTLAALAQATTRIRLGLMVTGIHYRHPAVLANMASAVDVISGGRLELGIGAGWNEHESAAYGIALGTPRERSDRFEEACEVLVSLLANESTTFDGQFYQLKDARNEPKGPQAPHLPICIGGSGEKRTLRTAARYAQHWNFGAGTPAEFERKRDVLYAHCADIGRDPSEITLSSHVHLGPNREIGPALDEIAALGERGLELAIFNLRPPLDPGVLAPIAEAVSALA